MKHTSFRKAIQWLGLVALVHAAAMLFYIIVLSSSISRMLADSPGHVAKVILSFNAVFDVLILCYRSKVDTSYVDYRKAMKDDVKAGTFSLKNYFDIKEHAVRIGIFAAFQLPFVIFFAVVKDFLYYPLLFSRFYIMDAGCYLATGSALLGFLLNTLLFGTIYTAIKLLFILLTKRNMEKELCL